MKTEDTENGQLSHFCHTHMPFQIFHALAGYPMDIRPSLTTPAVNNTNSHRSFRLTLSGT